MRVRIKKGLDIPLAGAPEQLIEEGAKLSRVALLGRDVIDLKPGMRVHEGDRVRLGQPLFVDKQNPDVPFVSPGSGIVESIKRGERRVLKSVIIRLEGDDEERFDAVPAGELATLDRRQVRDRLIASGLWTAFRTRPFSKIPSPQADPDAIFVTAIDTNPLAADPAVVVADAGEAFGDGLAVLRAVADVPVYVCTAPGAAIACPDGEAFRHAEFAGPHPAGLVGTHMHFLNPVGRTRTAWHIGYQDVIALGRLMTSGRIPVERVIAIGGPPVQKPRLVRTRLGASLYELLENETDGGPLRVVSGSPLSGSRAVGSTAWLGRYHNQVCVLEDSSRRDFLSWLRPGADRYSSTRAFLGHLTGPERYAMTASQNGRPRAMVSTGSFEKVMPLDILATPLLKALLVRDTDTAQALGCLELDEEDLALMSFVCAGKYEYGPHLRSNLREIEANG